MVVLSLLCVAAAFATAAVHQTYPRHAVRLELVAALALLTGCILLGIALKSHLAS